MVLPPDEDAETRVEGGQGVTEKNVAGAGLSNGSPALADAAADGHMLHNGTSGTHTLEDNQRSTRFPRPNLLVNLLLVPSLPQVLACWT